MQVGRKDVSIFVNGAVLYYIFTASADIYNLPETAVEEINLKVFGFLYIVCGNLYPIGVKNYL